MPTFETFEEAEKYLDLLTSIEKRPDDPPLRRLFRLERMEDLLSAACSDVGDPYSLRVVHVAGTKGKGSVVAMITAILTEADYRVGSFMSPHVMSVEERISMAGRPVSKNYFRELLSATSTGVEKSSKLQPSYFEMLTTCAIRAFLQENVDLAIMEIGLGGRLDCTNVLPNIACAITNISLDHTQLLGNDIASIAKEKAGVIKGTPVVSARQSPEALSVIQEACEKKRSPLVLVGEDVKLGGREVLGEGQEVSVSTWKRDFHDLHLPLNGARQHENLGVALGIIEMLVEREGFDIQSENVRRALRSVRVPARVEYFPGMPPMIIDGAHNEASVENLVHYLQHDLKPSRVVAIFGINRDKKVAACLRKICSVCDLIVLTETGSPRSSHVDELTSMLPKDFSSRRVRRAPEARAAYRAALDEAKDDDLVVCTGSFYLAGVVRQLVLERKCQERPAARLEKGCCA